MAESINAGDELSNMKLAEPISLANINDKHIKADTHKVKLTAHPKGVLLQRDNGETWLVFDAAIVAVKKATPKKTEAKKPEAKK